MSSRIVNNLISGIEIKTDINYHHHYSGIYRNGKKIYVGCLYISEFKKWKPYGIKPQDTLNKIHYLEKKIL